MRTLDYTKPFRKDCNLSVKRGKDMSLLVECLVIMCSGAKLPDKYKDHSLEGEWRGHRELHLEFDWLLVYRADGDKLYLERLGRHSDIFKN